jgi:hypothetical protein
MAIKMSRRVVIAGAQTRQISLVEYSSSNFACRFYEHPSNYFLIIFVAPSGPPSPVSANWGCSVSTGEKLFQKIISANA